MFIKKCHLLHSHFKLPLKLVPIWLLKFGLESLSMLEPRAFGFKEHDLNSGFALSLHHLLEKEWYNKLPYIH